MGRGRTGGRHHEDSQGGDHQTEVSQEKEQEIMSDEETLNDDELTPQERDAVQQMRNSGLAPGEAVKRAMASSSAKSQAVDPNTPLTPMQQKQAELLVEGANRRREFTETVKGVVDSFEGFDATDLKQIQATAAETVAKNPDYAKWSYDETKAKLAEATKAECERRGKGSGKSEQQTKAEKRLEKEDAAVDSGKGGGRSAPPAHESDEEDFDGSLCGTGDEKAFAITDAELNARYSQKAQKFLKKERGKKV
jgi:hypothetical protein